MEVETPILENTPGGADARPFITHHNALDMDVYLRISCGELWQKRLLVAGFPKVFEIGRIFRNEGQSREHLQDYTQLESYEAFADMQSGMTFIQELYRRIAKDVYGKYTFEINGFTVDFAEGWPVLQYGALIKERFGIDPLECTEAEAIQAVRDARIPVGEELNLARAVDHLWKAIRKGIQGPAFLTGVPVYMEPLAKRSAEDPRVVERFQVLIAGSEVGKGFSELNDPQDQRGRFETQQAMRDAGEVMFYRRSGTMDFNCAACHAQTEKRIRASVLPSIYDPMDWSKAISWPAQRTSHDQVRSSQHRVLECLWQMRYPNIKNGSDASIALISFWTDAARGQPAILPDLKR